MPPSQTGAPRGQERGGGAGAAVRGAAQRAAPSSEGIVSAPVQLLPQIPIHIKEMTGGLGVKNDAKDAGSGEAARDRGAPARSGGQTCPTRYPPDGAASAFPSCFPCLPSVVPVLVPAALP